LIEKIKTYLMNELGVGEEEIEGLIEVAKGSLAKNFEKLERHLSAGEMDEFARVAHTIKGVLLNLGLEKEAALSKEIELKAKEGESKESLSQMVENLKKSLAGLI